MKRKRAQPEVSVVVPAYMEAEQIADCLDRLAEWLESAGLQWEIVVVDDGSTDATPSIVRQRAEGDPRVRLVAYRPNRGKGFAVRTGLRAARGRRVLFTDADLSTPPEEIATALELLGRCDVVVGTRAREQSQIVVHQRAHREWMGRTFNLFVRLLGLAAMPDTQCGFKAFRAEVLPELLAPLRSNRFAFDVELIAEARRQGLRLCEQPVRWYNRPASRVRLVRDSAGMLLELVLIAARVAGRRRAARRIGATAGAQPASLRSK
ncbi:MAG: glycosyltransferase family 2 protein [Deltaproteobacteria bacterium]|nr:MAG: glycosyltransferase family 2 protein [Deltaproteobacteria bacterium]